MTRPSNFKPKPKPQPSLFDVIERERPETCPHEREYRSLTIWREQQKARQTMTCEACLRVRGRYPGE